MRTWGSGVILGVLAAAGVSPSFACATIDPNSGIDLVPIGAVGNAPWQGDGTSGDQAVGRGQVNYQYSIGKFEVTTAQWVEFFNAAYDRPANDRLPHLYVPNYWGAAGATPNTPGGLRWSVPAGNEMRPVGGVTWRMAAMYCNWLCNGKSTDHAAFMNGAYDVSTFGYLGASSIFTDQLTHNPGAQYWIPTWDEWMKAAHYDPNKSNADGTVGGWWKYSITSDTPIAYGPPGVHVVATGYPLPDPNGPLAQANASWRSLDFPAYSPYTISLGAYPDVTSPWGLYDTAGGTGEWTEEYNLLRTARGAEGGIWGFLGSGSADAINYLNGDNPSIPTLNWGFRIASNVPSPGPSLFFISSAIVLTRRRQSARATKVTSAFHPCRSGRS